MARVKRGVQAKARHKKVLKQAKGFRGARSRTYKVAKQAVMRAGQYAYRDRSCLLYTSPSPRDRSLPRMPSSA